MKNQKPIIVREVHAPVLTVTRMPTCYEHTHSDKDSMQATTGILLIVVPVAMILWELLP